MVWAVIICALLLFPTPALAANYTAYQSVSPNSSYLDWADSYYPHIGFSDDYVFFRSGQFQYCLAVGDLSYSSGTFSGDDIQCTFLNLSSGGSGDLSVTSSSGSFNLNPSSKIVYSNLGSYPTLNPLYFYLTCFIFISVVALIMSLLRYIWSFLLRMGVFVHAAH